MMTMMMMFCVLHCVVTVLCVFVGVSCVDALACYAAVAKVYAAAALIGSARRFYTGFEMDAAEAASSDFLLDCHRIMSDATNSTHLSMQFD